MRSTRTDGCTDRSETATAAKPATRGPWVIALFLLLAGCTAVDVERTLYPGELTFDCSGGRTMQVTRVPDGLAATVQAEGRPVTLTRVDSAAEEKYGGDGFLLYLDRDRALLEKNGQVIFGPCRSQTALPTAPRRNY